MHGWGHTATCHQIIFLHFRFGFFLHLIFLRRSSAEPWTLEESHHGYHIQHAAHTAYVVAMLLFLVRWKTDPNYHITPWLISCQDRSVTSLSWWSLNSQRVSFSRDGWPFPEEGSLLVLILECCWSFAGNQRTMRLHCAADTKSATITFTFTLHYWIFIHWALSQWVMSWMIDEAKAFCLRSSRINTICRAFSLQNGEAARKKQQKNNDEQKYKTARKYFSLLGTE